MPTQKKIDAVADIKDRLERAAMVISTNYRGLNVKDMQDLRRKLREGNLEIRVIKNSLLKLAADQSDRSSFMEIVEGPTALAIAYEDVVEGAKAVTDYAKSAPAGFAVRGAFLDGQILTEKDVAALATIPPKPVLIAQIAGGLQSPLIGLVRLLDAPIYELNSLLASLLRELPGLLDARITQLEGQESA
ncbi:MAG: 50S ribosomal protein L10 [Chloroflexi bacterium]|nr:50S ribosomal protein L10 [Chloroflexota bacterium]